MTIYLLDPGDGYAVVRFSDVKQAANALTAHRGFGRPFATLYRRADGQVWRYEPSLGQFYRVSQPSASVPVKVMALR